MGDAAQVKVGDRLADHERDLTSLVLVCEGTKRSDSIDEGDTRRGRTHPSSLHRVVKKVSTVDVFQHEPEQDKEVSQEQVNRPSRMEAAVEARRTRCVGRPRSSQCT